MKFLKPEDLIIIENDNEFILRKGFLHMNEVIIDKKESAVDFNDRMFDFIKNEGIKKIHHKEMELLKKLIDGLVLVSGSRVYGKKETQKRTAVTAFNLERFSSNELAFKLQHDYDIQIRGGLHCAPLLHKFLGTDNQGMLRISPGYFNTEAEVNEFLNIIETLI